MGRINREISLTHEGETKYVTASNRLIMRIDAGLKDMGQPGFMGTLGGIERAVSAAAKDPGSVEAMDFPIFGFAHIIARLMEEAGFQGVDEDHVYDDLVTDLADGGAGVAPVLERLFTIISPPGDAAKNRPAPDKPGRKPAKSKRQK